MPRPVQKPLFSGPVIRFEDIDPSQRPKKRAKRKAARRPVSRRGVSSDQQAFDFDAPAPVTPMPAESEVEPALYCEHRVAGATHRALAASIDLGLVIAAATVFLAIFQGLSGGALTASALAASALAALGVGTVVIGVFYKILWCLGNMDSPGTRWTGLRLLNFDGKLPSPRQRFQRLAGLCLSVGALGLGLLWALGDQDTLAWHDQISKTFPSPRG
ncbi:MAG: RDD family protein [bacterium]|nr:RDD family protein [bacterium]